MSERTGEPDGRLAGWERSDVDLHAYMVSVYLCMAAGVALSGLAAWSAAHDSTLAHALFTKNGLTGLGWVVTLAPLALVLLLSGAIERLSMVAAGAIFVVYAALVGLSLGGLFLAYAGSSVVTTFVAAAAGFAALAWLGSMTRRDLSALSAFITISLVGLIVAMLVDLFLRSASFDFAISAIGLLLFAGLTAFDAQRLRRQYQEAIATGREQYAVLGALTLYLDFLNLFLFLMRFTGRRRL